MYTDSSPDADRVHFSPEQARTVMCELIGRLGYDAREQGLIADHLLDAALCGYEYSGLPKILDLAHAPKAKLPRRPAQRVHETPVSAMFDGGHTVAMITVDDATDVVIAKASEHGFAVAGVFNSWMSGRSAYFVERMARAGLVGMHTVASYPIVAPPGAARPAIGTNPVAFGFPTLAEPLVIDLGTSAFMMTELGLIERRGGLLPEGVAIDAAGKPTREPAAARQGAVLHFAGYRGFAIGLAVQALGVMAGAYMSPDKQCGYLLVAMRPDLLVPLDAYRQELSATIDRIKAVPRMTGVDEIRIPSERAFRERARRRTEGVVIDRRIWELLQALPD
ncbi:MAG: Ldh family oxidoreductase [Burkholderiales bacterium]|nr:Ldh family oxidoreductase [Burkholderiales bacterium]